MTTVALVAAKDAAGSIGATVTALAALTGVERVIVVDDGSVDDTGARALAAGAQVVRLDANRGKGGALAAGLAAAPDATRYLLADADLGATASGLASLLKTTGDLVVGVLPSAGKRGGFGTVRRLAASGIRRACRFDAQAPLSGQRVVDGRRLRGLELAPRFGVEVGMTIDLVRAGAVVAEVPVEVEHHHRGRSVGGFRHRCRQGRDVAEALLPRVTTPAQRMAAIALAGVTIVAGLSALSYARQVPRGGALPLFERVLLFAFDGVALDALTRDDLPVLTSLTERGATGALSVRTTDRRSLARRAGPERPSAADAYTSLGASARVRAGRIAPEAIAFARDDNAAGRPGALGDALHTARLRTAAVTVGDSAAASAVMDRRGRVGDGTRATPESFAAASAAALREAAVVIADPGRSDSPWQVDRTLSGVLEAVPSRTLVIVFSPTPPGSEWQLTPVVLVGDGIGRGAIASSTTRRAGLGGLVDLAPTTLAALGVEVPDTMTGTALRVTADAPDLDALVRHEVDGAARSRFFLPAAVGYTVAALAFYLALIAVLRAGRRHVAQRWFRVGACAAAAFPLATLCTAALQHWLHGGGESPAVLVGVSLAIGALASRLRGVGPVYAIAAATVAIIAVDAAATGPLHSAGILGYSLQTTGRFYGLPNASFAVFAGSLFLTAAWAAGASRTRGLTPPTAARCLAGATVMGAGVVFVAAPWLGNDVGGLLTLAPTSAAAAWVLFGRRFTPRVLAIGGLGVAVALGLFVAAQAAVGGGTHLGRFASGDRGSLVTTIERRIDANLGLLVDQWWGFGSLALAAGSIVALLRLGFRGYLPPRSPLRVATLAILAASLAGFAVNDSGPVVNVLCLVVLAPAIALRSLDVPRRAFGPAELP